MKRTFIYTQNDNVYRLSTGTRRENLLLAAQSQAAQARLASVHMRGNYRIRTALLIAAGIVAAVFAWHQGRAYERAQHADAIELSRVIEGHNITAMMELPLMKGVK